MTHSEPKPPSLNLMNLPTEIRQEIFTHVLRSRVRCDEASHEPNTERNTKHRRASNPPRLRLFAPLLSVNHQIRWEMIHVLKKRTKEVKQIQEEAEGLWFPAPVVSNEARVADKLAKILVSFADLTPFLIAMT